MASLDLRLALPDDVMHLAVGEQPVYVKCVKHTDKKRPNMAVFPDHLHCFTCGYTCGCAHPSDQPHGPRCDQFRLEALAALLNCTTEQAAVAAPRYTSDSLDAYRERAATDARRDPLPMALAQAYQSLLYGPRIDALDWLIARGLSFETLEEALIGHNGFQFTIPIFSAAGDLLSIRFRRDDEYGAKRPKYMGLPGRNGLYVYGENWLDSRPAVICEGELDALLLHQYGLNAVSATNGARQAEKVPALVRSLRPDIKHLVIATDQDEAGEEAARQTKAAAEELGFTTERATWPSEFKDITEFYTAGGTL